MAHIVSAQAKADLDRIWDYVYKESDSEAVADRQIDAITERFYLLNHRAVLPAERPSAGRAGEG